MRMKKRKRRTQKNRVDFIPNLSDGLIGPQGNKRMTEAAECCIWGNELYRTMFAQTLLFRLGGPAIFLGLELGILVSTSPSHGWIPQSPVMRHLWLYVTVLRAPHMIGPIWLPKLLDLG